MWAAMKSNYYNVPCFCFRHHDIAPSSEVMNEMKVSLPSHTPTAMFHFFLRGRVNMTCFPTGGDENEANGAQLAKVSLYENNNG